MSVQDNIAAAYQAAFNVIFEQAVAGLWAGTPASEVIAGFMAEYANLNAAQALVLAALSPPPAPPAS